MSFVSSWSARNLVHQRDSLRRSFCSTRVWRKDGAEPQSQNALQVEIEGPDPKPNVLPPLNRPLGVRERPTTIVKTRTQRMKELMDSDVRTAQRRHLIKEAGKGYFHDMNMTRKHGGKTWIAPKVLIREDKALYLPNISGKNLQDNKTKNTTTMCYGRVTVLAMLGTKISEVHAQGFIDPTHARFSSNPHYQYIQINLQENLLKSFLVNLFANSLRGTVPPELHANYLVSSQNMEYVREPLGMTNSKVGYVYLIDENLKIRWGGCADAALEETQALESCTGVLLKRLEKKPKDHGTPEPTVADTVSPTPLKTG
ncbi:ATP10 protein-domain-containing protein [Collybia nuda]|uniref:ATP10 protein-domain-containing protein n=1 Tax=Collybia nuda TaxID=64659 RepID=A0A9P5XTR8_9AGAR|nr:ATP10 protein-domain-containing protein [Collybia nuda]